MFLFSILHLQNVPHSSYHIVIQTRKKFFWNNGYFSEGFNDACLQSFQYDPYNLGQQIQRASTQNLSSFLIFHFFVAVIIFLLILISCKYYNEAMILFYYWLYDILIIFYLKKDYMIIYILIEHMIILRVEFTVMLN